MSRRHVMLIAGTRPEVIKLGPVVEALRRRPDRFAVTVVATGQHREMLGQALACFGIVPDVSLGLMQDNQDLLSLAARSLAALGPVLDDVRPDAVLVQGDTTTTLTGALAAHYRRVPVGHVEAGLRSHDRANPHPEEANRHATSALCDWHFAPTEQAGATLLAESIRPDRVFVTGNTVVDALARVLPQARAAWRGTVGDVAVDDGGRLVLVTCHRRESFGSPLERILVALRRIVEKNPDVRVLYPVHPNPNVQQAARRLLAGVERVHLVPPLDYLTFVAVMARAYLILTDSGGVQEEAPSLGRPVLVLRTTTERPEGIAAGVALLVGTDADLIVAETQRLLDDAGAYQAMSRAGNPYGDGRAAERIVAILDEHLGGAGPPPARA